MKFNNFMLVALVACSALVAQANTEEQSDCFGKWRIAIGGAFNGGVSADLRTRNLPVPGPAYRVPADMSEEAAWGRAENYEYDGGGYIRPDSSDSWRTQNWKLPESSYRGNGRFELDNSYQSVIGSSVATERHDTSEDRNQFGISAEVSRELLLGNEEGEHQWGVDAVAAFSYFFQREVYSEHGRVTRSDMVEHGVIRTIVDDPAATYEYDTGHDSPVGGMYGHGNYNTAFGHPSLLWENVGSPFQIPLGASPSSTAAGYSSWGDYQELEMLFLARPWFEITDWWRIFANIGVGVSWGRLDCEFRSEFINASEDFSQWDVYGVAGVGTIFRYKQFDISLDVLGRFLRDDMDINGHNVTGSLSRSDWGIRLMVGYEF